MNKALFLSSILILLVALGSANVPGLEASPGEFNFSGNESIDANRDTQISLDVVNQNESQKIYDITLENQDWITWNNSVNGSLEFDLNESQGREVSGTINPPTPDTINESLEISYRYNNSGDITQDSNYFPQVDFFVESDWVQTEVGTQIFEDSYEIDLDEERNSVFRIENLGDETAYNVTGVGEYIEIQDSKFDVEDDRIVDFSMQIPKPDDSEVATNMTNKTYETGIRIEGDNFESKNIPINLTVPYNEYEPEIEQNGSLGKLFDSFEEYCRNNAEACNITETVYENRTVEVNNTPVYQANLTEEQRDALRNLSKEELEQDNAVRGEVQLNRQLINTMIENFNATLQDRTTKALEESQKAQNQSEMTQRLIQEELDQREQRREQASSRGTIALILFLVLAGLGGGIFGVYKLLNRRNDYRLIT